MNSCQKILLNLKRIYFQSNNHFLKQNGGNRIQLNISEVCWRRIEGLACSRK